MLDTIETQVANWKSQLKKGPLELAVLALLKTRRRYGYNLLQLLNQLDLDISRGSIYPALLRLQRERKIAIEWESVGVKRLRKYYKLTPYGELMLIGMLSAWREHKAAVDRLISENNT